MLSDPLFAPRLIELLERADFCAISVRFVMSAFTEWNGLGRKGGAAWRGVTRCRGVIVTPGIIDIHIHYDGQSIMPFNARTILEQRCHLDSHVQLRARFRAGAFRQERFPDQAAGRCRKYLGYHFPYHARQPSHAGGQSVGTMTASKAELNGITAALRQAGKGAIKLILFHQRQCVRCAATQPDPLAHRRLVTSYRSPCDWLVNISGDEPSTVYSSICAVPTF